MVEEAFFEMVAFGLLPEGSTGANHRAFQKEGAANTKSQGRNELSKLESQKKVG